MIDGFKFKITDPFAVQSILNHPKLGFVADYELRAEILRDHKLTAKYKGLRIECYTHTIYVSGNLYEYWTGVKNYENFKIEDAWEALRLLEKELRIDLSETEVVKLEWGLNVQLPQSISANSLIENVLVYKGKIPSHIHYNNGGLMRIFKLNEIEIKIYNKGKQLGKGNDHYLRYEIVIRRKQNLSRKNINNASDLFN